MRPPQTGVCPALRCAGVTKSYGATRVIDGLDLTAERGEFMALLGPSGCGKTTILRLIAGFEQLDAGTITVGDRVVAEVPPGGHYLGTAHTMRHFRDAFYRAELFDYNSAEQWELDGAKDSYTRANAKVRQMLAGYEPPVLEPGLEQALNEFMRRRKAEIALEPHDF